MIASESRPSTAPIFYVRCLVHRQLVALDGEGRLLGKCSECAGEAADALVWLRRNPYSTNTTDPGGDFLDVVAARVRRDT